MEQSPFAIDYSARVLDDVRLAVTDAFFSLPRGGAEIGGILLGHHDDKRITIVDTVPMPCEHAFGPSFVLSPKDQAGLTDLIASANANRQNKVVGWYHSHTRSEIFLSDADLEIHHKFFPEPWQIAIVLKPHTFQPMRVGFFFREKDGTIHSSAPYRELVLDPLPMRPAPPAGEAPEAAPVFTPGREPEGRGPVINVSSVVEPEAPTPIAVQEPAPEPPPPSFLSAAPPEPSRGWVRWLFAGALGIALGGGVYATRANWLPMIASAANASSQEKLALSTSDHDGQLQLQWNGNSRAALASTGGSILILDGEKRLTVELGRPHVLTGSFTYARTTGRVDVTLILPQTGGKEVREAALFAGDAPRAAATPAPPPPSQPSPSQTADTTAAMQELRAENARLRQDNAVQVERNKRLEKGMEELRKIIQRDEQRKRLDVQNPDTAKQ